MDAEMFETAEAGNPYQPLLDIMQILRTEGVHGVSPGMPFEW